MRKLLTLFFAASLFVACNNDKKDDRRSDRDRDRDRDDYRSRDDEKSDDSKTTDYKDDSRDKDTERTSDDSGGWTSREENKFTDDCVAEAAKNVGQSRATEYCDCMLNKLKRMYSSYSEAEKDLAGSGQEEINKLAQDCNQQ